MCSGGVLYCCRPSPRYAYRRVGVLFVFVVVVGTVVPLLCDAGEQPGE